MTGSRRLLFIGVIAGIVILLGIVATLLTGVGRDPHETACNTVLNSMVEKEYAKGYGVLSSSTASSISEKDWTSTAIGMAPSYENAEVALETTESVALHDDDPEGTVREELRYTVINPASTSDVSCYTLDTGDGVTVDGLVSKVRP